MYVEATQGMLDVMEIVNKFLNGEAENQKLKLIAEETEERLEVACFKEQLLKMSNT